ncbi:MAG: DUF4129 domain-containing protein, partial [Blastocatellia bacterium]
TSAEACPRGRGRTNTIFILSGSANHLRSRGGYIVTFLLFTAAFAFAAAPVSNYFLRLERAADLVAGLTDEESEEEPLPASVVVAKLMSVKQLLPAGEEVETRGRLIRVDNAWLHEAIGKVIKEAGGDVEQRYSMLTEIEMRLDYLREQVKQGMEPRTASNQDARAKVESILARAEYRPAAVEESSLKRWARIAREFLAALLRRLFGAGSQRETAAPRAGSVIFFRAIIILATAAALLFALYKLARLRRGRLKSEKETEVREVLGEEIAEDLTSTDLLAHATELARRGDYRAAIRRAYIAFLVEMEQRGKLRLHKSKTNSDYLNALRAERQIFAPFSAMTGTFEHVWYGDKRAGEGEFNEFVSRYRETTDDRENGRQG